MTYGIIFDSYCTSDMQTAIREDPNFISEIRDYPLRLLALIRILMHTPKIEWYVARLRVIEEREAKQVCDEYGFQ